MQDSEPISSTSFRYMSENVQFSRIKNVILPHVSSQLYSYGYNDFIADVPVQIDNKINAYESSFYMDSSLCSQNNHLDGTLAFCSQSSINNYQSGPSSLMTIKSLDCPLFGACHLTTKSSTMPTDYDNTIKQQQLSHLKRQLPEQLQENKRSPEIVVGSKSSQSEWTSNKKRAVCCQGELQDYQISKGIKEVQKERVPLRRSQKLADRITALQKLVSPYGKTDTASVLHEASIFIKVLQDQIENMFHVLSSSLDNELPQSTLNYITGEKESDLRNRGLCLVPISLTQELIKEENAFNKYCS